MNKFSRKDRVVVPGIRRAGCGTVLCPIVSGLVGTSSGESECLGTETNSHPNLVLSCAVLCMPLVFKQMHKKSCITNATTKRMPSSLFGSN